MKSALCFPAAKKRGGIMPLTMTLTWLIYGDAILLAVTYYAVPPREWFVGPRINVEHTNIVDVLRIGE